LSRLSLSFLAWIAVWAFWLVTTHRFHPTWSLALIVTTCLVTAYAIAAYVNHLILLPWFRTSRNKARYFSALSVTMVILTAAALTVIRMSYTSYLGPDPDPNGVYKHFAIDLFGMAVHLIFVAVIVRVARKWRQTESDRIGANQDSCGD
jgi:hypothetical protein